MNTTSEVPQPGPRPGASALAVKLGVLGMISGALSWALINFADELHLKFEYEGYGLELLPVGVYPGLVFGLLFGGLLRFSAKVSWPRAIGYVFAAAAGYMAAFHVAFYLIATVNEQGSVTITVSGIPAGLVGSLVLGVLAKILLQVPARLVLRRPVIVGTLAGALLGLGSIDDHNGLGFLAFFVLWQGAYGASLAPMWRASAQRSA